MSEQATFQASGQEQTLRDAATQGAIEARVTRYTLARLRIAQALVPFIVAASVLARRLPSAVTWTIGYVLLVGGFVAFLSAAKHLGLQRLRFEHGTLVFGDSGAKATTAAFRHWTYDGGVARLYGSAFSFKLHAKNGCGDTMQLALSQALGAPLELTRRGSPRARALALSVTIFGAFWSGFGLGHSATLVVIGVLCFLFGAGALAALSQKVIRGAP
jgi:hypothetical protein